jgi:hypothetical protein
VCFAKALKGSPPKPYELIGQIAISTDILEVPSPMNSNDNGFPLSPSVFSTEVFESGGWAADCDTPDIHGLDKLVAKEATRLHAFLVDILVVQPYVN